MVRQTLWVGAIIALLTSGCGEFRPVLPDGSDTMPGTGDAMTTNDGEDSNPPAVRLTVSNPSPLVNEEVLLSCVVTSGNSASVSFSFQSNAGRLSVNSTTGRAGFIVSESDFGTEFIFTCIATSAAGTSRPSNRLVVIPVG